MSVAGEVFRVKVTLKDCTQPVWRRIEIPVSITLPALHGVMQVLMGWQDYHLWAFEAGRRRFALPDPDGMDDMLPVADARRVKLSDLVIRKGEKLLYNYDFGDDWRLEIVVEAVSNAEQGVRYPRCLHGERAGPPEDCGGAPGFEELLAARRKPKSARARELLEWVGPDWNPEGFNLAAVNKELAALPAPRRLH